MVTWDEARKLEIEGRERRWNQRETEIDGGTITCGSCKEELRATREVQEWDSETLEPIELTALAPQAFCTNCDTWWVNPYGIVHFDQYGCHFCHEPLGVEDWKIYERGAYRYCDEQCADDDWGM